MPQQGQTVGDPLDRLWNYAQWALLLGPVVALPWMFGGVTPLAQLVLAAAVLIGLVLWLMRYQFDSPPLPALIVPLLLALGLGLVQLSPLGPRLLEALSPQAWQYRQAAVPHSDEEKQFRAELGDWSYSASTAPSLAPAATRYDLALLVMAVALFFLGAQLFSTSLAQKVLWGTVAANGAAFAFFGLTQQMTWSGKIYGQFPLSQGGHPFAAFVNKNNGAGYLNLCLAAAIGFLLVAFAQRRRSATSSSAFLAEDERESPLQKLGRAIGGLNGAKLFAITAVALLVVGVVSALSRGGWIAGAAALTIVTTALATTRRATLLAWTGLIVLVTTLGMIQYLGRSDAVEARWQRLVQQFEEPSDGRLAHWGDSWKTAQDFPLLGSGLGTYRYAYRPYESEFRSKIFYHAENQYVEAVTVGGVPGLILLLAAIALVLIACRRLIQQPRESTGYIAGIVGLFALVSQGVHALFDFGLYLPANMALFALLAGSVAGRAARCLPEYRPSRFGLAWLRLPTAIPAHPALAPSLGALLLAGGIWGSFQLRQAGAVESAIRTTRILREGREAQLPEVERSIRQLAEALRRRPDDADAQHAAARMLVHRYRLRMFRVLRRQNPETVSDESLWQGTAPMALHGAVYRYLQEGRTIELENLRQSELVQNDLKQAARHLVSAVRGCPLPPSPLVLLAELAPVVSQRTIDAELLELARNRAGADHDLLLESAFVEIQAGRTDLALADIRRSAELDSPRVAATLRLLAPWIPAERLVYDGLPDRPELLVKLARDDFGEPELEMVRSELLTRGAALLEGSTLEVGERLQLEAEIHLLRDRRDEAVERLMLAVEARPEQSSWRFQLAQLLQSQGEVDLAWEHARTCVRMQPDNRRYVALLQELIRARLSSSETRSISTRSGGG